MTIRLSQLAFLLAIAIVIVGLAGIIATWRIADDEFRDVLEEDLEQQAELLLELLTGSTAEIGDAELRRLLDAFEDDEEETIWVSVYDLASDRLLSNLDHDLPLGSQDDETLRRQHGGYGWHGVQEREGDVLVQLLRRDDVYADVQGDMLEDIVTPALVGGAITLLLLGALIMLTLGPLTRLVRELEARSVDSLAPLGTVTAAREIRVLRDSINDLMRGIDTVVSRERQFATDVAHELRTPLTTLKVELGGAEPDLDVLRSEVGRLARLVEQLLTLARIEQGQWQRHFNSLSLSNVYGRVIDEMRKDFQRAGMTLEAQLAPAVLDGDATLLEILLRNLLRNVLEHCPRGTTASVTLGQDQETVRLRVVDDGPGIASETRRQMSRGFTRLDSKSERFGLGLAICHRIAAAHGGRMCFTAGGGAGGAATPGLAIEVEIPRPGPAAST